MSIELIKISLVCSLKKFNLYKKLTKLLLVPLSCFKSAALSEAKFPTFEFICVHTGSISIVEWLLTLAFPLTVPVPGPFKASCIEHMQLRICSFGNFKIGAPKPKSLIRLSCRQYSHSKRFKKNH